MYKIKELINKLNLKEDEYELYGNYKAKLNIKPNKKGKLILVTSINPTPFGEGKTTLSIGLVDSLNKIGINACGALREPSLGPVFGRKGGAIGGGKAKIEPEDDINLHFNGDFHAIESANNLLCAIIDNHIYQGNELGIDRVTFNRCMDMNDRALRHIKLDTREEKFDITPASEMMAIFCLSSSLEDLKNKIGNIIVGYTKEDKPVFAKELNCVNAITLLLKEALKPNLVSTLYGNPVIVHGGPFANIAHGCNSIIATDTALSLSDYVVTEAGFGSDCGALKFFDIKSRFDDLNPICVIINVTVKALKYNGENSLEKGICNLKFHIENMKKFNDNVIVSLNRYDDNTEEEIDYIRNYCKELNTEFVVSSMYSDGETGCIELANKVLDLENTKKYEIYDVKEDIKTKIEKVCKLYGCNKVEYKIDLKKYPDLPICIAKTPDSITDNKNVLGYPKDFTMTVTDIKVNNGAGFIVVYMGGVLTMPGLGKNSKYLEM